MDIQILHGLPPALIGQAAGLYADAFAHYFAVTASVHQHRKQLIEQAIKPEHAFVAVADSSTLLGLAGYQHGDKRFLRLGFRAIVAQLGWYRGIVGGVMLSYLDRPVGRGFDT